MRVIREYWLAVEKKDIPLKELLGAVDGFLRSHGYAYRRLWSPSHPELTDGELRALFAKIPRPCNPAVVEAVFEDVEWFGGPAEPYPYQKRCPALANGIHISRYAGNSFCHVHFFIEVTAPGGPEVLRDDSAVAAALRERFGKLKQDISGHCVWLPEETAEFEAAKAALSPQIRAVEQTMRPFRERAGSPAEWTESLRQIELYAKGEKPGFSGKKLALTVFPKARYRYRHDFGSCFEMVRRTPLGHRLTVSFDSAPPAYFWQSASISLSGMKFCYPLYREQIRRESPETVEAFMRHCRQLAEQAEAALDRPLYDRFGASPDWWFER